MILNYPVSLLAQFTILNYPVSIGRIDLRSCKWKSSVTYWFKVEPKQSQSTSDSQVKVALSANHFCHWFYFRAFFSFQGLVTGDVVWMIMEMLQILSKQNRFESYTLIGPSRYIAFSNVYFLAVHSLKMLLFFFFFFFWRSVFVLQIICTSTHNVSFAQVRGSVPVYWSQPGYKYRPPPRLDRGTQEKLMVLNRKDTRDGHVHA